MSRAKTPIPGFLRPVSATPRQSRPLHRDSLARYTAAFLTNIYRISPAVNSDTNSPHF
ncbi:hypothetical protein J6590_009039 [Homalodisca vitripennis]|nr:hypothetical protein J6590_009039 [Homalodisca vitripennis]